jgi:hypothetical protein
MHKAISLGLLAGVAVLAASLSRPASANQPPYLFSKVKQALG